MSGSDWVCSTCTLRNPPTAGRCHACNSAGPSGSQSAGPNGSTWNCPVCTFSNDGSSQQCMMCGTPSPQNAGSSSTDNSLSVKDYKPENVFVSNESQFTYGGESACAFGALSFAEALLRGLDPFAKEEKQDPSEAVSAILAHAAQNFKEYFHGGPRGHASPREILQSQGNRYSNLTLMTWASTPSELRKIESSLVFPEAMLPCGEIQIQNARGRHILDLLEGFSKTNTVLSFVTIGYAFGVHCRQNGSYVVFDTHKKDFAKFGYKQAGAYCALFSDVQKAAAFVNSFTLDSRNSILSLAQGVQQSSAASNIDITAVRLTHQDREKNAESKEQKEEERKVEVREEEGQKQMDRAQDDEQKRKEKNVEERNDMVAALKDEEGKIVKKTKVGESCPKITQTSKGNTQQKEEERKVEVREEEGQKQMDRAQDDEQKRKGKNVEERNDMVAALKDEEGKIVKKTKVGESCPKITQTSKGNTPLNTTIENDQLARKKLMATITDKKLVKLRKSPGTKEEPSLSNRAKLLGQIKKKDVKLVDAAGKLARAESATKQATKAAFIAEKKTK